MRRNMVLCILAIVFLAMAARRANSAGNCPGPPYECTLLMACPPLTWCQTAAFCDAFRPNRMYSKSYYLRRCTSGSSEVICSFCMIPVPGNCCATVTAERSCPTGTQCE